MLVFAVMKSNKDLMAWLDYLAKHFGNRTLKDIIAGQLLTSIQRIERQ